MAKSRNKSQYSQNRSREARRATSPAINTDKSLKEVTRPASAKPVLSANSNGGIRKSKIRRKRQSKSQRLRQEKGLARAEVVMDRMEKKVEGTKKKARSLNARRKAWDEVNGTGRADRQEAVLRGTDLNVDEETEWEDEDEEYQANDVEMAQKEETNEPFDQLAPSIVVADLDAIS